MSKKKSTYVIKISALLQHKIFGIILSIFLITTVFSSLSFTAKSENNKLINNISSKFSEKISEIYTRLSKDNDNNKPGGFFKKIINFVTNRSTDRKEILPLHVVTNYNGTEKITKMKLLRPTSIDVDGDGDKDIRVSVFRIPSIDLKPPALAMKTILVVHRLMGMNNIKNDLFEIYLEYYPRIITKFFYLTLNMDLVRIGYQSPAGGEVPKTFILTDKTAPHFLYPKLKTTHKISVNPGSATGKHPLNLILSFIDLQNYTFYQSQGYAELKIMVNYSPAVKIKDITFNRYKDKIIGKGQTLEIIRDEKPSNVTFSYNQETDYLDENKIDESKSSTFTVGDIPKHMEISWSLGKNGYLDINTNNEDMGYFKASINNAILFGFDPETETNIHIGWENRTLKSYFIFNLSLEVYTSVELEDFYFILTNFSEKIPGNNSIKNPKLELTASRLILNLNSGAKVGNYFTQYFLFPIIPGILSATSMDWHSENLQITATNFTVDIIYPQNSSETPAPSTDLLDADNTSNPHFFVNYLDISSKKLSLSYDLMNGSLSANGDGNIDIRGFDFVGKNARTSFSSLSLYLSSSMDLLSGDEKKILVSGNGFLEIVNLSHNWHTNISNIIFQTKLIRMSGDFSFIPNKKTNDNITINGTGKGHLKIDDLYFYIRFYEIAFSVKFSHLNISSNLSSGIYSALAFDSSGNITLSITNGFLEIKDIDCRSYNFISDVRITKIYSIKLSGDFSLDLASQKIDDNTTLSMITSNGRGYLEIKEFYTYSKDIYSNNDFYEREFTFSCLNISSLNLETAQSIIRSSNFKENLSVFIENGILNITDVTHKSANLGVTTRKTQIDLIRLSGDFLFERELNDNLLKSSATGTGYLEIKNFYSYTKYDDISDEFSFSYLNLSSYQSNIMYNTLYLNSSRSQNLTIAVDNGLMEIRDLNYKTKENGLILRNWYFGLINASKNLLLNFESTNFYLTRIATGNDGSFKIRNINIYQYGNQLNIDSINISKDSSFVYLLPIDDDAENHSVFVKNFDGAIEICGISSSNTYLDAIDNIYLEGNGDIKIKRWFDADTSEGHIYLESQNGLTLDLFSIQLDNGIKYHIERQGTIAGYIGPGFMHIGVDLNGDGDGFIFIDSSDIDFEDVLFTYTSSSLNRELRFTPNIESFDADSFLLQWDSFTLNNEDNTVIPYNWYKTGDLSADFDIGLMDGDNYYQLWPLDDLNEGDQELEATEYLYNEGAQPLETGPPKPQKPVGPHGGIILGRIVEGNSYTFSTLNNDIDQLLSYKWDWGDGTYSEWPAYLPSGVGVTGTHTWAGIGSYSIHVKAKNMNGEESGWSDALSITVRHQISGDEQSENQNEELVGQNQNYNQGQPINS